MAVAASCLLAATSASASTGIGGTYGISGTLVGCQPNLAHGGICKNVCDGRGNREGMNVPAIVGQTLLPRELPPFYIENLLGMENKVEDGLETGVPKLAPMPDALDEFVEIVIE